MTITEGTECIGESGKTYLAVSALGQENVWTAVEKSNPSSIVVLKSPSADDTRAGWPRFQHEMIMHELFKDSQWVRKQVDRIPASNDGSKPPVLVLEILEGTLWDARSKRPFTKGEVKAVAYSILQGVREVHDKGLVYADLKMQNIMVSGFDPNTPGDGSNLTTKLGDLGIVMSPSMGKVQPVAYRAPEIHLKYQITEAADIWGFALIYCHLLEAQNRFDKTGLYDDLNTGRGTMPEREEAAKVAVTNDYDLFDVEYYKDCPLPCNDPSHEPGRHWEELKLRGLGDSDVEFLKFVLKADPTKRPTASAILRSKWFAGENGGDASAGTSANKDVSMTDDHASALPDATLGTGQETAKHREAAQVQAMKRKHSDQPQQRTIREYIPAFAVPFLPWLAKSDSSDDRLAAGHPDAPQSTASQPPQQAASTKAPTSESGTATPYLPWVHTSDKTELASPPNAGISTGSLAKDSEPMQGALISHPLVAEALSNQDNHSTDDSSTMPTTRNNHEASSENKSFAAGVPNQSERGSTTGTYLSYR